MKTLNNSKIDLQLTYQELITLGALCQVALKDNSLNYEEYQSISNIMQKLSTTGTLFLKNQYSKEELQSYLDSKESVKN